jgi:hypothetical protein
MSVECCFDSFVEFVDIRNFANCSNGHLRGEAESFSDFTVNKVMKLPIIESFTLKSCFGNVIASNVEAFHSLQKTVELRFVWNEFDQKSLLHISMDCSTPYLRVFSNSFPCLKTEVPMGRSK